MNKYITINIEEDEQAEQVVEEVLRQLKLGDTSGIDPTWDITDCEE